jgi:hypothetical protein
VQPPRIAAPNYHRERVVESQGRSNAKPEFAFVALLHELINIAVVSAWRLFENSGQRRSRIFRINIDSSGENRLLANKSSSQIKTALHCKMRASFNNLSEEFSQNKLLGKILGANHNSIGMMFASNIWQDDHKSKDQPPKN